MAWQACPFAIPSGYLAIVHSAALVLVLVLVATYMAVFS